MHALPRLILTLAAMTLLLIPAARADVPTSMNIQGRLQDSTGAAANPGLYIFTFRIFDQEAGGTKIWPASPGEIQTLLVNDRGLWSASVGDNIALTEAVFQDTSRWLEVTVNNGVNPAETLPRMKLKTSPFTYRSASSQNADLLDGFNSSDFAAAAHGHAGLWDTSGADYYYDGGRVGVGTSTPDAALEVSGGSIRNMSLNENNGADDANLLINNSASASIPWNTGSGSWGATINVKGDTPGFQVGLGISAQGDVPESYGLYSSVIGGPTTSTQHAGRFTASGAGLGTTYGVYSSVSSSGAQKFSGYFQGGDFQVTSPQSSGSQSVRLPDDAIQAAEILDEPGIASQRTTALIDFTSTSATTMIDLETVTIQIPTSGYIDLRGSAYVWVGGAAGTDGLIDMQIDETAGGGISNPHRRLAGTQEKATASNEFYMVPFDRVYLKPAGTYTFRLEGARSSITAGTTVHVYNRSLTAVFYPTSYGTVATTVQARETGEFEEVTAININPADAGLEHSTADVPTVYQVDLRELELKAARAEVAAEKARRELLEAQERVPSPLGSSLQGDR